MSHMKRFAENLSDVLGHDGEINDAVMEFGHDLMELAEKHGLKLDVDDKGLRIILQGGRELEPVEAARKLREVSQRLVAQAVNEADEGVQRLYEDDASSIGWVADMIEQGRPWQALSTAENMETGCRELIPHDVWRLLISYRGYKPDKE